MLAIERNTTNYHYKIFNRRKI